MSPLAQSPDAALGLAPASFISEEAARVAGLAAELDELVRMIALRGDIRLSTGPAGSGWWFQPLTGQINADEGDLRKQSPDDARGLAIHEASHAAITRYSRIVPRECTDQRRWLPLLLNAIEDCRIEEWMQRRLPGCVPWVKLYNDRIFGAARSHEVSKSRIGQYCMGLLCRWWFKEDPEGMDPLVLTALDSTWPGLLQAIAAQPPATRVDLPALAIHYWRSPVSRAFLATDAVFPPDGWEMLVRMAQYRMWAVIYHDILPHLEDLWRLDLRDGQWAEAQNRVLYEILRGMRDPPPGSEIVSAPPGVQWAPGGTTGGTQEAIQRALDVDPDDRYLQAWKRVAPLVDSLAQSLLTVLKHVGRSRWIGGYNSGARLDPRVAMKFDADPRYYTSLWQRKTLPRKVDPAFIFVLDRSGSMSGETMERAFEGLVLLVEVCMRLGIAADIWSFADSFRLEHTWDEGLGPAVRTRLGRLPQQCDGGTNMHATLDAVAERLPLVPHRDRILIMLSDGQPSDATATRKALQSIVADSVTCIGLGIGPGTADMRKLFHTGLFAVPVTQVASSLASIIREGLGFNEMPGGAKGSMRA